MCLLAPQSHCSNELKRSQRGSFSLDSGDKLESTEQLTKGEDRTNGLVLGWERSHLHQFLVGSARYGEPDPEYDDDMARCYVSCYEAQGSGYETCTDGISGESTGPS